MRRCLSFGVAFAVFVLGAAPASARPPSLTGEVLSQHIPYTGPTGGICTTGANGTDYTFGFAGNASGPYPGSFTEHIQVSVGPDVAAMPMGTFPDGFEPGAQNPSQSLQAGQLLSVNANFTISSPAGAVTGTKTLTTVVPADFRHAGVCKEFQNQPVPGGGTASGAYKDVRAFGLSYAATITTGEGSFSDDGSSDLQGRQGRANNDVDGGVVFDVNDLGESFDSSDEDGDGVPDPSDACPSTPADTANGCPAPAPSPTPAPPAAPPAAGGGGAPAASDSCPSAAGPVSNSGCPVNAFSFSGKALRKNGFTILRVAVPGPGVLKAAQAKVTKKKPALIKKVRVSTSKAGKLRLKLKPTKAGKKRLARRGRFSAKVRVTYTPTGGKAKSRVKPVVLARRRFHG